MIFYFYGENDYLLKSQVRAVKQKYREKTKGDLELENFDLSERSFGELLDSLAVMPMFVTSRLVVVTGLGQDKTASDKIDELVAATPSSSVVVIVDPQPDKRTSLFKKLSRLKGAREFKKLSPPELNKWLQKKAQELGGELSPKLADNLIERAGTNQWTLANELEKLINYSPKVTQGNILDLVNPSFEQTIFELMDLVIEGKTAIALQVYERLSLSGTTEQQIIGMLNWQYRNIALSIEGEAGWGRYFGVAPYAAQKAAEVSRHMSIGDVKKAYQAMVKADMSIKTGQKEPKVAVEELIVELSK